jgi:TolA-binding protein
MPAAYFERGRAYVTLKEVNRGEADFNQLISSYPGSAFVPRAMVQLGLLYYENGENQKAITQFKKVIEDYKSTAEARNALTGLKNTYVEMNDVESYFAYVKTLGGYGDVTLSEKDSLMYSSGERMYMTGNCEKASETFRNYLAEFSNGIFRLNALYYLADCAKSKGNTEEALKYFIEISEIPNNEFMHQSLLGAADILYSEEDYTKAYGFYEKLERVSVIREYTVAGLRGQLRSSYQNGDAAKTISSASKIMAAQNIPEELQREALYMSAKANYSLNQNDQALAEFRKIAVEVTSVEGAESKYRVAELQFKKEQLAEAERTVNEFIDMNTPHQYWMARVFILLSDISVRKGDKIQAIATLRALRESYPIETDGVIDEVKSKLDSLVPVQEAKPDTLNTGKGGSN